MAEFKVYSKSGVEKYEGAPHYVGTYLKPGYVEFSEIGSPTPITWEKGDYLVYTRTGLTYRLYTTPQELKQGEQNLYGGSFLYENVQFFDDVKQLEECPFTDIVPEDNELHYSTQPTVAFTGKPSNVAERVQACLEAMYGSGTWEIRIISNLNPTTDADLIKILDTEVDFVVSGLNCLEVLDRVYETWNSLGWAFTVENGKNVITIGAPNKRTVSNTTAVFSRINSQGLNSIKRSVANADELGTRLSVFGSMKNMSGDYYRNLDIYNGEAVDIVNLMLPLSSWGTTSSKPDPRKAYLTASSSRIQKLGLLPRTAYFDGSDSKYPEIFPSLEGVTIGDVIDGKAALLDSSYVPSLSVYTRADRVDEVLAATNPTDAGVPGTNGKAYNETIAASLSSQTFTINQDQHFEHQIASATTTEAGKITVAFSGGMHQIVFDGFHPDTLSLSVVVESASGKRVETFVDALQYGTYDMYTYTFTLPESITLDGDNSAGLVKVYLCGVFTHEVLDPSTDTSGTTGTVTISSSTTMTTGVSYDNSRYFTLQIPQIGFDINLQADLGNGKTISMKSGMCAARDFVIKSCTYSSSGDKWILTIWRSKDEDLGILFPNSDYQIVAGDRFVLLDIAMPELYIATASQRLLQYGQQLLDEISVERPFYELEIDAKFMHTSGRTLREGMWMHLSGDENVDGGEDYAIIDTLNINEDASNIPTYDVTLRKRKGIEWTESVGANSSPKSSASLSGDVQVAYLTKERADALYLPIGWSESIWLVQQDGSVKLNPIYSGAWTDGFLSAGGLSDSSGGGGVTVLAGLEDVSLTNLTNNDILKYDATTQKWQNVPASSIGGVTSVAGLTGAVSASALSSAMGLGAAAYLGVGNVASGNAGLVTGGAVYSAINTAVASAIRFQGITTTTLTDGSTTQTITIDGSSYTAQRGDVVVDNRGFEFLWTGSKWQQLGDETSYALKTVSITGTGYLTGGGNLEQSRTIDLTMEAATKLEAGNTVAGYFSSGILGNAHLPSMYIGTTSVQFSSAAQALTGITTATLSSYLTVGSGHTALTVADKAYRKICFGSTDYYIEIDENGYLHTNVGFYSDSFVSAGGLSDSGGGGGIDALAMWKLLTNNNSLSSYDDNTKIAVAHIPDLTASKISDLSTWLSTNSYAKTTDIPSALKNPYSLTIGSVSYDGSVAKTVAKSDITTLLNWGTVGSVNQPVYINAGNPAAVTGMYTKYLTEPDDVDNNVTVTVKSLINTTRSNKLAFLPDDQIIIEKTTDGGVTWVDYGASASLKKKMFSGYISSAIVAPRINSVLTANCGLRITFTGMKYNVPEGTSETSKYAYWNPDYVADYERYCKLDGMYFWYSIGGTGNGIKFKIERASGTTAKTNTWVTVWDKPTRLFTGGSGGSYIPFAGSTFGGGTTQTGNSWNWRVTMFPGNTNGDAAVVNTNMQLFYINGYGPSVWREGTAMAGRDHLYAWDDDQNATFPGHLYFANAKYLYWKNASGANNRSVLGVNASNSLLIGSGTRSDGSTVLYGKTIYLYYGTSGSNAGLVISDTGNVGIRKAAGATYNVDISGTTNISGLVTMNGGAAIKSTGNAVLNIVGASATVDYSHIYVTGGNNNNRPLVLQNGYGKVGIGVVAPAYKLEVGGTLGVTGTTTLSSTLTVTGATTLNSTLEVTGNATFNAGANLAYGYALRSKNSAGTSNLSMMYLSSGGLIIGDGTTQASNNTELRGNNIILKYSASATQGLKINSSGRIFIGASDTADSASGYANGQYLVWDSTNKAWHLVGNFYADGFISAGGLSSSSGGGGIDADAMWTLLANTDSSHKINFAHIPDLSTDTSWTNSDRGIGFSNASSMGAIRFYNTDSSKGLTYNPSTGELKAGAFVKRGGTSSQILLADGTTLATSGLLTTAGGTLTGALTLPTGSTASTTTAGLNIGSVGHIGAASSLLGIYSTGNIVLRPNGASSTGYGLELTDTDITFNGVGLFRYGSYMLNDTTVDTIPTTYDPGMYSLTLNNVEYNAILHGVDRNSYWFQMRFKPYYGNDIWYRTRNTTTWRQFAFTDSTVAKANQLATSRSLWGNSFNGTADISGNISVVLSGTGNAIVRATNDNGSISIIASSNRGLYDNTSSRWLIATNGTYNWIPNTVNLGIGTTTPAYTLDVAGTGRYTNGVVVANGAGTGYKITNNAGSADTTAMYMSTSDNLIIGSGTAVAGKSTYLNGSNIIFRYYASNAYTEIARMTSDGYLGIGTAAPAYPLDVVGTGFFSTGVNIANNYGFRAMDNPSSGDPTARALIHLNSSNVCWVGYGMAAPGYDTNVAGTNLNLCYGSSRTVGATLNSTGNFQVANSLELTNSSAIAHISFGRTGASYIQAPNTGSAIVFSAGTTTLSRAASELYIASGTVQITHALNLGNSTASRAATMVWDETNNAWKLNGNFYATGFISAGGLSNSGGIDLTAIASNILPDTTDTRNLGSSSKMWSTTYTRYIDTASGYVLRIKTAGTQRMAISASGSYVGIGSDPNSSYSLYTSGAISCSSLTQRSDARLKDIIGDVELSVSDIAKAPAIFFRWKVGSKLGAGSLAQYWKELTPWCVIDDGKELAMDYGQISLLSVINVAKAVESHEQKIKRLETTVAAQQEEINRLRALTN